MMRAAQHPPKRRRAQEVQDSTRCSARSISFEHVVVAGSDVVIEAVQVADHARGARVLFGQRLPQRGDRMVVQALPIGLRGARAEMLEQHGRDRADQAPAQRAVRERHDRFVEQVARERAARPTT